MADQKPLPRVVVQPAWSGVRCELCGEGEPPHEAVLWLTWTDEDGPHRHGVCEAMGYGSIKLLIGVTREKAPQRFLDDEPTTQTGFKKPSSIIPASGDET